MKRDYDVVCIGMAILDSMIRGFDPEPVSAAGYRAESGTLNVGGDAVNEASALAKLGVTTALMSRIGNDAAGDMIISELTDSGVSTDLMIRTDDCPTPVTTIFIKEDGNRVSITNSAHSLNFHPERYMDGFSSARAIILGSLFRSPFNDPGVIQSVLVQAKSRGMMVFADTKLPNFRRLTLEEISDSLPMLDYITPNRDEAEYYTGKKDPADMADVFLGYGVKNVIIKLGSEGCYLRSHDTGSYLPALKTDAVDATGAGDNFMAGFVSEILRGSTAVQALKFANACGALCTTAIGAGSALKSREQVLQFAEESGE